MHSTMEVAEAARMPRPGEIWSHWKGGLYRVICTALREDVPGREVVVYQSLADGQVWVRDLGHWLMILTLQGGRTRRRFEFLRDEEDQEQEATSP